MATVKSSSFKRQKVTSSLLVNGALILICLYLGHSHAGHFDHLLPRQPGYLYHRLVDGLSAPDLCGQRPDQAGSERGYQRAPCLSRAFQANTPSSNCAPGSRLPDGTQLTWFGNKRTRPDQCVNVAVGRFQRQPDHKKLHRCAEREQCKLHWMPTATISSARAIT